MTNIRNSKLHTNCGVNHRIDTRIPRQDFDVRVVENVGRKCRDLDNVTTAPLLLLLRQDLYVRVVSNILHDCKIIFVRMNTTIRRENILVAISATEQLSSLLYCARMLRAMPSNSL
jgi:hypothetical protein